MDFSKIWRLTTIKSPWNLDNCFFFRDLFLGKDHEVDGKVRKEGKVRPKGQ